MGEETVRVWLVERTYSDDEQNIIITTYATTDGGRYYRREQALTTFSGGTSGVPVAREVPASNLGRVEPDQRASYADEASRMADNYDPEDRI